MKLKKPEIYESIFFRDDRGILIKSKPKNQTNFSQTFIDSYISISKKNVFRGLHYQKAPYLQEKFFTIIKGEVNLYCLNINKFEEYLCFNMISNKETSVYVPKGWATGIHSLSNESIIYSSSNQEYKPDSQININYRKIPELNNTDLIISQKDQ